MLNASHVMFQIKKTKIPEGIFITSIGEEGNINGLILASCGLCNFGMKGKKCVTLLFKLMIKRTM